MSNTQSNTMPKGVVIFALSIITVLVIVGMVMFVSMINIKIQENAFLETAVAVDARCQNVKIVNESNPDVTNYTKKYYADITYEYNNVKYHKEQMYIDKEVANGDIVLLYIDPQNPDNAKQKVDTFTYVIGAISGILMVIAGIVFAVLLIKQARK